MSAAVSPPRIAGRLLALVLPDDVRGSVEGDLLELYAKRRMERGPWSAAAWYWREVASLSLRFGADRTHRFLRWLLQGDAPSGLDLKLGGRMLIKYPGLAIIGGLGMAIGIAIGAGAYTVVNVYFHPTLPLHEGERVVRLVNFGPRVGAGERRMLRDFLAWRSEMKSVVDLAAFRSVRRSVSDGRGPDEHVTVAEMSASGFRVARVPPLLGRALIDADERPGGPPVIVIGHDVWRSRFDGDSAVVGQTMRVGGVAHTIVGVMPEDFAFPIRHSYWMPLRLEASAYEYGKGPVLDVVGRLAPGISRGQAQAELSVLGQRAAAEHPATHARLRPQIVHFTSIFSGDAGTPPWAFSLVQLGLVLVLVLVSANVAILVYARTVTRTGEIAVRTALGATRRRIVAQLFAEALVLAVIASAFGLAIVAFGLRFFDNLLATQMGGAPFWVEPGLSAGTVFYALVLAVLGAVVVGVLPGLRATGVHLQAALGRLTGGAKPQLGRTWTVLVVAQVAITVAVLPPALYIGSTLIGQALQSVGFAAEQFVVAEPVMERVDDPLSAEERAVPEFVARCRTALIALEAAAGQTPTIAAAAFAEAVPGEEGSNRFEIDGGESGVRVRDTRVGTSYFDAFGVRALAGRTFTKDDVGAGAVEPVVVNRTFAEEYLGGAGLGRRIRLSSGDSTRATPWSEIVGVVEDFPAVGFGDPGDPIAKVYRPAAPGEILEGKLVVRVGGSTSGSVAQELRDIAASIDPMLQLRIQSLDSHYDGQQRALLMGALALALALGSVLLLSAGGVYAMMSFTVAQRRREIGIRAALGAGKARIMMAVFTRAAGQLAVGVVAGFGLLMLVNVATDGRLFADGVGAWLPVVAALVCVVGTLSALGPARGILRVQPTEALRPD